VLTESVVVSEPEAASGSTIDNPAIAVLVLASISCVPGTVFTGAASRGGASVLIVTWTVRDVGLERSVTGPVSEAVGAAEACIRLVAVGPVGLTVTVPCAACATPA